MKNFVTYRKFQTREEAADLLETLGQHQITGIVENESPKLDSLFVGNEELLQSFHLKINQKYFNKADEILEKEAESLIDKMDKDYYLFGFSNEELKEILLKYDEWSEFDYQLAQKILVDRGENITPAVLASYKDQRKTALSKPEKPSTLWFIFSIITIGGIGLFYFWHVSSMKKTLPDGSRVYVYEAKSRKISTYLFIISLIIWTASLGGFFLFLANS